jgi:PhnB protein
MTNFRPDGWLTVSPRVFTEDVGGVVGFLKLVFGARGEMRTGALAEMRIGDSLILVSDGGGAREARKTFLDVYVENTEKTYQSGLPSGSRLAPWLRSGPSRCCWGG